ncbi:MAG: alanine dehydrogenase [Candidatus Latescibacterota bacterium]
MIIGVPKEIKADELRVALLPVGVRALVRAGHRVLIEECAGQGAGASDADYRAAGAQLVATPEEIYAAAEMVVKVKEPLAGELALIRPGQVVFTYFHFAAAEELTRGFCRTGAVAVAYETVQAADGSLPLLIPMSEIAGRMAVQQGAKYLEAPQGGRGVLLAGLAGVASADVVILGGGVVGQNAAKVAAGMGASVNLLDISLARMRRLEEIMPPNVQTLMSNSYNLEKLVTSADLLIGAVLVPGARAPKLVTRQMLSAMKKGAVIVDVAVDQGGCVETIRPTTHHQPTYVVDGIVHYGVANMPGAVPRTATIALTNATFPYVLELASHGWREACRAKADLASGLNVVEGRVTHRSIAEAFGLDHHPFS